MSSLARPGAAALLLAIAPPLAAQQVSLQLGGLHARYADSLDGDAGAVGARLVWEGARARAVLDAGFAQFTSGGSALQTWGSLLLAGPSTARSAIGLQLDGVFEGISSGPWTGTGTVEGFAALVTGAWTSTVALAGGAMHTIDSTEFGIARVSARTRRSIGAFGVSLGLTATTAPGIQFADATAGADWRGRSAEAGLTAGSRAGDLGTAPWIQARGRIQLSLVTALEAGVGSYPRDLSGFARGFYAQAGLRISLGGKGAAAAAADPREERRVVVEALGPDSARVTIVVPDAQSVAIAGSWNAWTPVPLESAGRTSWRLVLPIGPGTWRFALLVNGTQWIVPPGVTTLPDDFGGQVGVLVVAERR